METLIYLTFVENPPSKRGTDREEETLVEMSFIYKSACHTYVIEFDLTQIQLKIYFKYFYDSCALLYERPAFLSYTYYIECISLFICTFLNELVHFYFSFCE